MEKGDIYLYSNQGSGFGSLARPVGLALEVTGVGRDASGSPSYVGVRDVCGLTQYRVWPDQLSPFPEDCSLEEALVEVNVAFYGEPKGSEMAALILRQYDRLVADGSIPEIDETRLVRMEPSSAFRA